MDCIRGTTGRRNGFSATQMILFDLPFKGKRREKKARSEDEGGKTVDDGSSFMSANFLMK